MEPTSITFFTDESATTLHTEDLTFEDLRERIAAATAPSKSQLPWLKLAQFGDVKTSKGSLRHNKNVLHISGVEADYDGETISLDEAVAVITEARLRALIYTSPRHSSARPRWRVLLPTSQERAPAERKKLVARINGVFDGALAPESFVLSQSYYFGSVNGNPEHRAVIVEGDYIDQRADLDAGACDKGRHDGAGEMHPSQIVLRNNLKGDLPKATIEEITAALAVISSDDYWVWFRVAGALRTELGDAGWPLFREWSKTSKKFNERTCKKKWEDVADVHDITAGTIFQYARDADPNWRGAIKRTPDAQPEEPSDNTNPVTGNVIRLPTSRRNSKRTSEEDDEDFEFNVLHGADLEAKQLKWLWAGRIPLGTVVTLIGVPAAGKSNVFLDIAARVTTGRGMPPGDARIGKPADVLLFCTEDQPEQTIIPRLLAMGGDKSRLHIVPSMKSSDGSERGLDLTKDVTIVERYLEVHPEIGLIIFDPISEFLGTKIDSHNNTAVRAVLGPVMKILHRQQMACICVTHMAKTKAQNVQSAALGSQAFSAAPRGSLMVTDEMEGVEDDNGSTKLEPTGRKLLSVNMGNLAPPKEMKTLAFRIETKMLLQPDGLEIKISHVKWDGEVEITARQIHEEQKPKSKEAVAREKAIRFIMREMADPDNPGEWRSRPASEMNTLAAAEGISERTLDRARNQLNVAARQGKTLGMPGRGDVWWWVHEGRRF